jgi:hypothetical protein
MPSRSANERMECPRSMYWATRHSRSVNSDAKPNWVSAALICGPAHFQTPCPGICIQVPQCRRTTANTQGNAPEFVDLPAAGQAAGAGQGHRDGQLGPMAMA